tara:strand:+ start:646 stop:852 length:207 start_codon:yes stop_codon:yes gene_type:complete
VSTDYKSGPSEILQQGELGFLCRVSDPEALGYAIKNALDSPIKKELLIKRSEDFSEKIIGALYEDIIV